MGNLGNALRASRLWTREAALKIDGARQQEQTTEMLERKPASSVKSVSVGLYLGLVDLPRKAMARRMTPAMAE
jgi:hypothetical protein